MDHAEMIFENWSFCITIMTCFTKRLKFWKSSDFGGSPANYRKRKTLRSSVKWILVKVFAEDPSLTGNVLHILYQFDMSHDSEQVHFQAASFTLL